MLWYFANSYLKTIDILKLKQKTTLNSYYSYLFPS